MSNLSKEATDRIQVDAENYSKLFKHGVEYRKPAYADGALHEAERAQVLADALKETKKKLNILDNSDAIEIITNALAKYKGVSK
jgi:hypothetical protein